MHKSEFSLSDLPASLRSMFLYWQGQADDGFPRLDDFDLAGLPGGLDNTILTEILHDQNGHPQDFETAFVGKTIRERCNVKLTGQRLSQLPGKGPGSLIWDSYMTLARNGRPLQVSLPYVGPDRAVARTFEVLMPLAGDRHAVQFALSGFVLVAHAAACSEKHSLPG